MSKMNIKGCENLTLEKCVEKVQASIVALEKSNNKTQEVVGSWENSIDTLSAILSGTSIFLGSLAILVGVATAYAFIAVKAAINSSKKAKKVFEEKYKETENLKKDYKYQTYYLTAEMYYNMSYFETALSYYKLADNIIPNKIKSIKSIIRLLNYMDRCEEALDKIRSYEENQPTIYKSLLRHKAFIVRFNQEYDDCKADNIEMLISVFKEEVNKKEQRDLCNAIGILYRDLGVDYYEKSSEYHKKAYLMNDKDPISLYLYAISRALFDQDMQSCKERIIKSCTFAKEMYQKRELKKIWLDTIELSLAIIKNEETNLIQEKINEQIQGYNYLKETINSNTNSIIKILEERGDNEASLESSQD